MKKIIKDFFRSYLFGVGIVTVCALFYYYVINNLKAEKVLDIMGTTIIAMLPITLLGAILFQNIHTKNELWARRAIIIAVSCVDYPLCFILFNIVKKDTITQYLLFSLTNIVLISLSCIITYIIADKIEQKRIEEINKKLNELK